MPRRSRLSDRQKLVKKKEWLTKQFDDIFTTTTDYDVLNDRIAKTLAKKRELLRILDLPQLPLHNNASELEARVQARMRELKSKMRLCPLTQPLKN